MKLKLLGIIHKQINLQSKTMAVIQQIYESPIDINGKCTCSRLYMCLRTSLSQGYMVKHKLPCKAIDASRKA